MEINECILIRDVIHYKTQQWYILNPHKLWGCTGVITLLLPLHIPPVFLPPF